MEITVWLHRECSKCGKRTSDKVKGKYCQFGHDPDGKHQHDWQAVEPQEPCPKHYDEEELAAFKMLWKYMR